jgi:N-acetylglucosaminyl-diphospho-decaprenol L-rhamnosyltransferase
VGIGIVLLYDPDPPRYSRAMTAAPAPPARAAASVSAVVVSYQTGPILADCLDALAPQVDEIILVDNGNPPDISARLAADARLKHLVGHGNVGFGAACNRGALAAKHPLLLFLNPDAILRSGAVAALAEAGADKPHPWLIGGRVLDEHGREQRGSRRDLLTPWRAFVHASGLSRLESFSPVFRDMHREHDPSPPGVVPVAAVSGAFFFTPKADFLALGGFDEGYFLHVEDIDLCRRYGEAGGGVWHQPAAIAVHRGQTSAVSSAFVAKHKAAGFAHYFAKNAKGPFAKAIAAVLGFGLGFAVRAHAALKKGPA